MTELDLQWPAVDEEVLRAFPPVLRAIVKALGFGRAGQFLNAHGGTNPNLPHVKNTWLGLDGAELARLRITLKPHLDYANRVSLPKPDKLFSHMRNQQIVRNMHKQTINTQVREYKLTNRQIMNIRRQLTKDERLQESRVKRNLAFDADELTALKSLAEEKLHREGNALYAKILNKLNRASAQVSPKTNVAQFDLF